jgi:hypothetical protein
VQQVERRFGEIAVADRCRPAGLVSDGCTRIFWYGGRPFEPAATSKKLFAISRFRNLFPSPETLTAEMAKCETCYVLRRWRE